MSGSRAARPMRARLGDRALFPDLEPRVYANHAAISPLSTAARDHLDRAVEWLARHGADTQGALDAGRRRLRTMLADLVGAEPGDLALLPNTSAGLSAIALSMPWQPGDRVVLFEGEFPANLTPWHQAARAFDLEIVHLPRDDFARPDGPDYARLDAALARGVRLVAISAVQYDTGLRAPLRAIAARCHAHGAELAVDATQSVGCCPIDAASWGIDYLACGGQKWLTGPEGAGFAWVPIHRSAALVPRLAGWLSHPDAENFRSSPVARLGARPVRKRFNFMESGALNVLGYATLEGAVALLTDLGVQRIFDHVQRWHDALEPALTRRGFTSTRAPDRARRSGILSLAPPPDATAVSLKQALAERGVVCSSVGGLLRFAPHWPNARAEVDLVVAAIDDALAAARA